MHFTNTLHCMPFMRPPPLPCRLAPGFPWCQCVRSTAVSPYRLAWTGTRTINGKQYACTRLYMTEASRCPGNPCCTVGVHKVEIQAVPSCRGTVRKFLQNGFEKTVEYRVWQNGEQAVMKLAPIDLSQREVGSGEWLGGRSSREHTSML